MVKVQQFEDLMIWKESRVLVNEIYKSFQTIKDYGFRDQIQRAGVSVMNNISEGFERNTDTEFRRFLIIAKASCGEVRSMLYLSEDLNYLSKEKAREIREKCFRLSGSIGNFIAYFNKS